MTHFIINPNAGTKKKSQYLALIASIKSDPLHYVWETSHPLEASILTRNAVEMGANRIIAVGGDGTINEVASVLVGSSIPLGVIPIGSGNGLARHLGIPMIPSKALEIAKKHAAQKMDVGRFNDRYFFCTAGIGFDASVAHRFAKASGRGLMNYIKATFYTLFNFEPIEINLDNTSEEAIFSLTIANANQFGNDAYISPMSNVQDGFLEIIKIKKLSLIQATVIGIRLFMGTIHHSNNVEITSLKDIKIKYHRNAPYHLDGEQLFTEKDEIQIQILPNALNVIC